MKTTQKILAILLMIHGIPAMAGNMMGDGSSLPPGHPPLDGSSGMEPGLSGEPLLSGVIEETMDTGNYTYVLINNGEKSIWAATERYPAAIGQHVTIPRGMMVKDFESPSLGRTFDELVFADSIEAVDREDEVADHHDHAKVPEEDMVKESIAPADGGLTVADIYQQRNELAGSTVVVRGRVVKYTERVMGQNWLHIEDGSSDGAFHDLTVSTEDSARKGEVVTVTGPVVLNEDLGHGYFYEVLIKGASVTRE